MKKEKQSNFELLRIVAMLMIIIFHSLVNFVGTRDSQYISNNIELGGVLLMLRYVFGQLGVILFAMISGYFLISAREKKNPFERAMATAVKFAGMLLYNGVIISVVIAVIYMAVRKLGLVGPVFYELINTTRNIFDDSHLIFGYLGGFWYLSVYFLLLVVINPLNRFLNKLTDNRTFLALIIVIIFVSVLFKFTLFLSLGRDAINAATIFVGYLLGGYMRKFDPLQHVKSRYLWAGIIMFIAYYMLAHEFLARVLHVWSFDAKPAVGFFIGYPGYVLAAIIFALFMRLKFSSKSVNSLAGTTLFVYICHVGAPFDFFFQTATYLYAHVIPSWGLTGFGLDVAFMGSLLGYVLVVFLLGALAGYGYNLAAKHVKSWFAKIGVMI